MATEPFSAQTATAWIGIIGVVVGSIISGGFLFFSQLLTRRSEERRQRRELAINTAIANWKNDTEALRFTSEKGVGGAVAPLDHYIIHMIKLSDLIERKDLTEEDIANELTRIRHASRKHFEAAKKEDQKRNE